MTLSRDLAWQNLEMVYRSSISYHFARYALGLKYEMLPPDVVHQAKRCLLDALGCAIGAYHAPGRPMCEAVAEELGGTPEATVFCSGKRTNAVNATLINSFLVRFLDYNDVGGGGHNSECIPGILAVGEREGASAKDFLTAVVISYELGARVEESMKAPEGGGSGFVAHSWMGKGWTSEVRVGLNMPPPLGKLMGMNEDQIANAIGICASHSLPLAILDTDREENSMTKNLRFGFVACDAITSCMLAKKGFTGPVRIVEGENGMRQVILRGDMDLAPMLDMSGWRILRTKFKVLCLNASTQGHVLATLALVKEHDLKPEDIVSVRIKASLDESRHTTALPKKYPRNGESADHSSFYATAIAIKERAFGPRSFEPEKFTDPVVLELIEKTTVEAEPSFGERSLHGISEITTRDGRHLVKQIDTPDGLGEVSLSDKELEEKFRDMATEYVGEQRVRQIFDTVWNLERLDDIRKLAALMVFPSRSHGR